MIALLAVSALLIAEPSGLAIADGSNRYTASAGAAAGAVQPLVRTPDGAALVAYRDGAFLRVERVDANLQSTTLANLGIVALVGPATDGFVTATDGLVRRYDLNGHPASTPAAVIDARELLALGEITVVAGRADFAAYGRNGRLQRAYRFDASSPVALAGDRVAVIDNTASVVRVYSTQLEEVAALRFPGRRIRRLAGSADGTLAVVNDSGGGCGMSAEVDLFTDVAAGVPNARVGFLGRFVGPIALDAATLFVTTGTCGRTDDTQIAQIGRDGKATGVYANVGRPLALLPFGPP